MLANNFLFEAEKKNTSRSVCAKDRREVHSEMKEVQLG